MSRILGFLAMALSVARGSCAIMMFPGSNPAQIASNRGVTEQCIIAMNSTLNCEQVVLLRTAEPDTYDWTPDDMNQLCTPSCGSSLNAWVAKVQVACGDQPYRQDGYLIRAESLPLMHLEGYNLACLKSATGDWCLIEDHNTKGVMYKTYDPNICSTGHSEWDPSICFEPGFDQLAILPSDVQLSNLYPRAVLCSDCFVKIFHQRLSSPFLSRGDFTNYLFNQWNDIKSVCQTNIALATATSKYLLGTMPAPVTAPQPTTTCNGQSVPLPSSPLTCRQISNQYNVPDGAIVEATRDTRCQFSSPICLPAPCELQMIGWGETCDSLQSEFQISFTQLHTWNKYMLGQCNALRGSQAVCRGPPGGNFIPGNPVTAPTASTQFTTTATPPAPTKSGTTAQCGLYYKVQSGDTCQKLTISYAISFGQFRALNSEINASCTNLLRGYAYCVAPVTHNGIDSDLGYTDAAIPSSANGRCGPAFGDLVCPAGECCSTSGYCGSAMEYCAVGACYSGLCISDEGGKSVDGSCGPLFAGNYTCTGTQFGACCSIDGYCGSSKDHCGPERCYSGACI